MKEEEEEEEEGEEEALPIESGWKGGHEVSVVGESLDREREEERDGEVEEGEREDEDGEAEGEDEGGTEEEAEGKEEAVAEEEWGCRGAGGRRILTLVLLTVAKERENIKERVLR